MDNVTTPQSEQDKVVAMVMNKVMSWMLDRAIGHTLRQNERKLGNDSYIVKTTKKFFDLTYGDLEYERLKALPELTDDEKVWYDAHTRSMLNAEAGGGNGEYARFYTPLEIDPVLEKPKGPYEL